MVPAACGEGEGNQVNEEKRPYFNLCFEGDNYTYPDIETLLDHIRQDFIDNPPPDRSLDYTISIVMMTDAEYEALPEI